MSKRSDEASSALNESYGYEVGSLPALQSIAISLIGILEALEKTNAALAQLVETEKSK